MLDAICVADIADVNAISSLKCNNLSRELYKLEAELE